VYKSKSKRKIKVFSGDSKKWLEAAERGERHIDDIKAAVRVFRRNAESSEPWPVQNGYTVTQGLSATHK
jgi:hypothetical protein